MPKTKYLIARFNQLVGTTAEQPSYYLGSDCHIYHPENEPVPDAAYYTNRAMAGKDATYMCNGPWQASVVEIT